MRVRFFSLVSYAPKDFIHDVCEKKSLCYAYILHDKDVNENGQLYEPHFHILLQTEHAHEPSAVCKWFRGQHGQNTFAEEVYSTSIYDYLTHTGFEDKFQYSADNIISNDIEKFKNLCDLSNLKTVQLLDDIISGKTLRYMASTYGRDFVLNSKKYITYAKAMHSEEKFNKLMTENAELISENFDEYIQLCLHSFISDK